LFCTKLIKINFEVEMENSVKRMKFLKMKFTFQSIWRNEKGLHLLKPFSVLCGS